MKHEKCVACNGSGYYDMIGSPRCCCCQGLGYVKTDKWIELEQTELEELKRLATIGKALEYAFEFSENDDYIGQINKSRSGFVVTHEVWRSVGELLKWAESEGIDE